MSNIFHYVVAKYDKNGHSRWLNQDDRGGQVKINVFFLLCNMHSKIVVLEQWNIHKFIWTLSVWSSKLL